MVYCTTQAVLKVNRVYRFVFAARTGVVMHAPPDIPLLHPRIDICVCLNSMLGVTPPDVDHLEQLVNEYGQADGWFGNYVIPSITEIVVDEDAENSLERDAQNTLESYNQQE